MSGIKLPPPANGSEGRKAAVIKAGSFAPEDRFESPAAMRRALEDPKGGTGAKPRRKGRAIGITAAVMLVILLAVYMLIPKEVTDIKGIGDSEEIKLGDTLSPEYVIEPSRFADEEISFSSGDESVFTVDDDGNITGVGIGEGKLDISVMGYTRTVDVTVSKKVEKIRLNKKEVSLYEGEEFGIRPTLLPEEYSDEPVTYVSSDESVAVVSKKGRITAKAAGSCDISVSAGGSERTVRVTVAQKPVPVVSAPASSGNSKKSSSKKKSTTKKKKDNSSSQTDSKGYFDSDDDEYF